MAEYAEIIAQLKFEIEGNESLAGFAKGLDGVERNLKEAQGLVDLFAKKVKETKGGAEKAFYERQLERAKTNLSALNAEYKKQPGLLSQIRGEITKLERAQEQALNPADVRRYGSELDKLRAKYSSLTTTTTNKGGGGGLLGAGIAGGIAGGISSSVVAAATAALSGLGTKFIDTASQFEKFEAILTNSLGAVAAKGKLEELTQAAATLPVELTEVIDAFIKLKNTGFEPTNAEIENLTDVASASGKSLGQLVEGLVDAQTFEFERLKEFGILAQQEGDKVTFTFREQKTVVDKNAESIRNYILGLGDLQGISGASAAIVQTLSGRISNLKDSFDRLLASISEGGTGAALGTIIDGLRVGIDVFREVAENAELFANALSPLGAAFSGLVASLGELLQALGLYNEDASASENITIALTTALKLISAPISIAVKGITFLVDVLKNLIDTMQTVSDYFGAGSLFTKGMDILTMGMYSYASAVSAVNEVTKAEVAQNNLLKGRVKNIEEAIKSYDILTNKIQDIKRSAEGELSKSEQDELNALTKSLNSVKQYIREADPLFAKLNGFLDKEVAGAKKAAAVPKQLVKKSGSKIKEALNEAVVSEFDTLENSLNDLKELYLKNSNELNSLIAKGGETRAAEIERVIAAERAAELLALDKKGEDILDKYISIELKKRAAIKGAALTPEEVAAVRASAVLPAEIAGELDKIRGVINKKYDIKLGVDRAQLAAEVERLNIEISESILAISEKRLAILPFNFEAEKAQLAKQLAFDLEKLQKAKDKEFAVAQKSGADLALLNEKFVNEEELLRIASYAKGLDLQGKYYEKLLDAAKGNKEAQRKILNEQILATATPTTDGDELSLQVEKIEALKKQLSELGGDGSGGGRFGQDELEKAVGYFSIVSDGISELYNKELTLLDSVIEKRQAGLDAMLSGQEKANAKQIQFEQDRLNALLGAREKAVRRQRLLDNIEATGAYIVAVANAAKGIAEQADEPFPLNVIAIAATVTALIASGISLISGFRSLKQDGLALNEGSRFVDYNGGKPDRSDAKGDTIKAWLKRGERVETVENNKKYGGLYNLIDDLQPSSESVNLAKAVLQGVFVAPIGQANNNYGGGQIQVNNDNVVSEILKQNIILKKQFAILNNSIEGLGGQIAEIIKRGALK
ncbi:MAG TPA: hypothetical protein PLR63_00250 [Paludibacteraceae bacterium]|nr:hypothetical protein [Paludibacteraceae bacterium]